MSNPAPGATGVPPERLSSGNVQSEGCCQNNERYGVWKSFYDDGSLMLKEEWQEGLEHGEWIEYSPSGEIIAFGNYQKGVKWTGSFVEYEDEWTMTSPFLATYENGQRIAKEPREEH